jgi:transketolase
VSDIEGMLKKNPPWRQRLVKAFSICAHTAPALKDLSVTTTSHKRFDPVTLRRTVIEMAYAGSTGHIAPAFSIIEILAVLYRSHLNLGDGRPDSPGRDYLILSKGHGIMAQYACMHELGWLTSQDLSRYFSDGTVLKGLSDAHVPGVETTSGSMGHGLSVGVGLAWAAKRRGTKQRCFVIVGDGEMNEGPIWEAFLFAAHWELSNLIVIIDNNGLQAMGRVEEVLRLGNIAKKLQAFGFETREVNGHDESALDAALRQLDNLDPPRPRAIVAKTVKGYGVSFMHDNNIWHYTRLTPETYRAAVAELDASKKKAGSL